MVVRRWIITLLAFALLSSLEGVSVDRFLSSTASQSPRQEPHESDFISPSFLSSEEASVSSNNGSSTGTPYCENGYSSPSTVSKSLSSDASSDFFSASSSSVIGHHLNYLHLNSI